MGYTHYWEIDKMPAAQFSTLLGKVAASMKKFYDANKEEIPLAYEYDEPEKAPEFSSKMIRFNGVEDDGHETFLISKPVEIESCKTARKPYDLYVCATLMLMKKEFGDSFKYSSDGRGRLKNYGQEIPHDQKWLDAEKKLKEVFPKEDFKIDFRKDESKKSYATFADYLAEDKKDATHSNKDPKVDYFDLMMKWEGEGLSEEDEITLFQHLVDTGMAWTLQGTYGRQAKSMIDAGDIVPKKK